MKKIVSCSSSEPGKQYPHSKMMPHYYYKKLLEGLNNVIGPNSDYTKSRFREFVTIFTVSQLLLFQLLCIGENALRVSVSHVTLQEGWWVLTSVIFLSKFKSVPEHLHLIQNRVQRSCRIRSEKYF